jgi:hypothetical protein
MYLMDYYTIPMSLAGLPSLSVPCGLRDARRRRCRCRSGSNSRPAVRGALVARHRARVRTRHLHARSHKHDSRDRRPGRGRMSATESAERKAALLGTAERRTKPSWASSVTSSSRRRPRCSAAAATSSAASPTRTSVRCAWDCRARCRFPTRRRSSCRQSRSRVRRRDSRVFEVRSQELLLSRHAQGLSDLAVRHAAHARRRRPLLARRRNAWLVPLTRIHLEEDTGKSTHAGSRDGRIAGSTYSLVDFNRAGVPLMECVSEPDIRTAERSRRVSRDAQADVRRARRQRREDGRRLAALRRQPLAASRRRRAEYGTKTEIKNMNSFNSVGRAIESEIARQIAVLEGGGRVVQETRGWDEAPARRIRCAAKSRRTTTAISRIPISRRSNSRRGRRRGCATNSARCRTRSLERADRATSCARASASDRRLRPGCSRITSDVVGRCGKPQAS